MFDLKGKVALITGAGSPSGIGYATAKALGTLGAEVIITGTTQRIYERVTELKQAGIAAAGYVIDLTEAGQVKDMANWVQNLKGTLHILVNNAGMLQVGSTERLTEFAEMTAEEFNEDLQRNLMTCFHTTRTFIGLMKQQAYGRIVNVSSTTGPLGANIGECGYGAAKAALLGLTKGIAIEVAKDGITINNVLPGWIATGSQTTEEYQAGRATPMGRSGTAAEVASMIAFLVSQEASYITGQDFVVDGGNVIVEKKG